MAGEPGATKSKAPAAAAESVAARATARPTAGTDAPDTQWPLWEVFVQSAQGAPHEHAGSVHATDAEGALQNARDVYSRRGEAISIWVVASDSITASKPEDQGPFFDPADDKVYRHPQFYKVPRGLKGF